MTDFKFLDLAKNAIKKGERVEARRCAIRALRQDKNLEDAWLILAAIASPEASVEYLQKALQINPESTRAQKGMQWAVERLVSWESDHPEKAQEQVGVNEGAEPPPLGFTSDDGSVNHDTTGNEEPDISSPDKNIELPVQSEPPVVIEKKKEQREPSKKLRKKLKVKRKISSLWLVGILGFLLVCATALFVFIGLPQWEALANSANYATRPADALFKPTLTPTATATFTPTPTPTLTPTLTPTETPTPTITATPFPTETDKPYQGSMDGYNPPDADVEPNQRWIDVDLTHQMVYAYVGNEIVNSFLVSTGTYLHPTVTGQYHIYVKYYSTTMSGPDYYLTNVPYTMYFYAGYSFHGTYWHSNFGTPMSHGCVNMYTPDAEWLFNWASVGTMVNVHY